MASLPRHDPSGRAQRIAFILNICTYLHHLSFQLYQSGHNVAAGITMNKTTTQQPATT
jgi:hypothetical protein